MRIRITDRNGVAKEQLINPKNLSSYKRKYCGRVQVISGSWCDQVRQGRIRERASQDDHLDGYRCCRSSSMMEKMICELEAGKVILPFGG